MTRMKKGQSFNLFKKRFWRNLHTSSGDTMIEVLIAIAVVSLVLVGAAATTSRNAASLRDAQEHAEAQAIANSQVEWIVDHGGFSADTNSCFSDSGMPTPGHDDHGCDFNTKNNS